MTKLAILAHLRPTLHESTIRRRAARAGYRLTKSRQATSLDNFGGYQLIENARNLCVAGWRYDLTLGDVASWPDREEA